jgi:hypothetical protein
MTYNHQNLRDWQQLQRSLAAVEPVNEKEAPI